MRIYQDRPSVDVLIAFAFQRYQDAKAIRLHMEDHAATYQDFPSPDPTHTGPMMNLSVSGLWNMLKAEQELWQKTHPQHEVTFA